MDTPLIETLESLGVMPVVTIDDAEHAEPLADALSEGGLPLVEVTLRTATAAEVIRRLRRSRPRMLVGAGTVLNVEDLLAARDAGAAFALAPGFSPAVMARAREIGMPFFPGVLTPSEVQHALAAGARVMKFFPAQPAGGTAMLEAIAAPFASSGARFIPTGGVKTETLQAWLSSPSVLAVGGTWIATRQAIAAGDWEAVRHHARAACAVVAGVRGPRQHPALEPSPQPHRPASS